jgi:hypothetical protein
VLSDYLVADPRMVRDLHRQGVPQLPVRVRDGTGLVGPLVIPGVTSCLEDYYRELLSLMSSPQRALRITSGNRGVATIPCGFGSVWQRRVCRKQLFPTHHR